LGHFSESIQTTLSNSTCNRGTDLDGDAVAAAAEDAGWKEPLACNTEEAAATGVFGMPTVNAEGRLFFGNDRLGMLDAYLANRKS
jgi:2-hydroxychromene-2-carboxylate isomerase